MKKNTYSRSNFGLNRTAMMQADRKQGDYEHWFWESKSKKKQKAALKQAEIDRMKAETAAMQKLMEEEQAAAGGGGMDPGKIALISGVSILLLIGAVVMIKKRSAKSTATSGSQAKSAAGIEASELIV